LGSYETANSDRRRRSPDAASLRDQPEPKYAVLTCGDAPRALEILKGEEVSLLVTDMKMPGMSGLGLLREIRKAAPELPVIIMTAYGTVESAVQAMKEGAADYILKPIKMDEMEILIEKTLAVSRLEDENREMKLELKSIYGAENIIGAHRSWPGWSISSGRSPKRKRRS